VLKIQGRNYKPICQVSSINDDFGIVFKLSLIASNIKREVYGVLDSFLSFKKKIENRKAHNMFLMLDPGFKSLCLVSSFVGQKEGVNIVDEYDRKTLYPMLLKCYHHLHLMTESIGCVDQIGDEDFSLDIIQQIASTSEPSKELITRELLIFKHYQVDPKDIKCPLQWWAKHEAMFAIVGFLACQILGIVGSQIETKRIFSLAGILTNLRRCHLQLENLENLIFVSKNLPSDPRDGCKSPSNLVELIQIDLGFEEKLEEFEGHLNEMK
jgi:hypothetical protein